jgi:methionyl-tRNA formyltransferase
MLTKNNFMPSPRIIFMGTPEFAVASLAAIVEAGFAVVAVVTAPDKPAGRGLQLQASAVKKFALLHHIPVLQPVKLKDPDFLETLQSYKADLQIVVAFRMLPELVMEYATHGYG